MTKLQHAAAQARQQMSDNAFSAAKWFQGFCFARRNRWKSVGPLMIVSLLAMTLPLVGSCSKPETEKPKTELAKKHYRRASGALALLGAAPPRALTAANSNCAPMTPKQIYRFIAGIDQCPTLMSSAQIQAELNDLYATTVLIPNVGGAGWPTDTIQIQQAIQKGDPTLSAQNYLVGEGGQIPPALTTFTFNGQKVIGNQDLRYVLTWGPSGATPVIFLSAAPAGVLGGTPPPFLQVIAFDPKKKKYNYYQYVSDNDLGTGTDTTRSWSWAGDSSNARNPQTVGQGCFQCHLNGGLNMKELTVPWNNWNSPSATISAANIPPAVAQDPIYQNLTGADRLQSNFQNAMFVLTMNWVSSNISNGTVSNVPELLRRLIVTTTMNFQSSQVTASSQDDVAVPADFFLNNSAFRGNTQMGYASSLNLTYNPPALTISRANYNAFVQNQQFALTNTAAVDGPPTYSQPGPTFFTFFVPGPAFEDLQAIKQLLLQKVISPQFAGAVLMVDFQNPVFSPARSSLLQYAQQISTGKNDGNDIPNQFASLVTAAVQGQPACDPTQSAQCSAEWQFLYYWNQGANWQTAAEAQIQNYLNNIGSRIGTPAGANDYITLSVSRGIQFSNYPLVCNLNEFELLLPATSLGNAFYQMNPDGTISRQTAYSCSPASSAAQTPTRP